MQMTNRAVNMDSDVFEPGGGSEEEGEAEQAGGEQEEDGHRGFFICSSRSRRSRSAWVRRNWASNSWRVLQSQGCRSNQRPCMTKATKAITAIRTMSQGMYASMLVQHERWVQGHERSACPITEERTVA